MLKFISWNVNGLRACVGKNFEADFKALDADFFCLQETKMQEGQLDLTFEGYDSYWNYAEKKGYSGTAIYTKHKPLSVSYGMGIEKHDHEGRVITLEYEQFYLVTVYTPNSQNELKRLDYRMTWEEDFKKFLKQLDDLLLVVISLQGKREECRLAHRLFLGIRKAQREDRGCQDSHRGDGQRPLSRRTRYTVVNQNLLQQEMKQDTRKGCFPHGEQPLLVIST